MHVVRAFIGVDRLQVRGVAHHLELGLDAVAAMHVARDAGDIERLAAIVALDDARSSPAPSRPRPSAGRRAATPAGRARSRSACRRASAGPAALAASGRPNCLRSSVYWRARCLAGLRRAHRAPGDAVAGAVEAAERPLQALDVGQQRISRRTSTPSITISPVIDARSDSFPRSSAPTGPSCPFRARSRGSCRHARPTSPTRRTRRRSANW